MITGVDIAAMLNGERSAALAAENTKTRFHPRPHFQAHFEKLYKVTAHVVTHPLVKDGAEKIAELARLY